MSLALVYHISQINMNEIMLCFVINPMCSSHLSYSTLSMCSSDQKCLCHSMCSSIWVVRFIQCVRAIKSVCAIQCVLVIWVVRAIKSVYTIQCFLLCVLLLAIWVIRSIQCIRAIKGVCAMQCFLLAIWDVQSIQCVSSDRMWLNHAMCSRNLSFSYSSNNALS
jgi:hypothetical protein